MAKRKLGRGLGALLGRQAAPPGDSEQVLKVSLDQVRPNPWQPRHDPDTESMKPLVASIRANGVLQPVVLRALEQGRYELVAGERRWRAAHAAGLNEIPAVVREVPDEQMLLLAMLENIVREDLNPIDRARGYQRLMVDLGWTQEQLGGQIGEARATVANTIRLLDLPEDIQDLVSRGTLTPGHARALLSVKDPKARRRLCERILRDGLSVRQAEQAAAGRAVTEAAKTKKETPPHIRELEDRFQQALGVKVIIKERKKGGRITIDFKTHDDFERILGIIEQGDLSTPDIDSFHV
jgi:ParB family chromosome partitioning protein